MLYAGGGFGYAAVAVRYELAIFDFDGTLADTFSWFQEALGEAADRFGFRRVAPGEIESLRGKSTRELMTHLGVAFWKLPAIAGFMRRHSAREVGRLRPFPGITEVLRGLDEGGLELAVVTSNAEENVRAVLGAEAAGRIRHFGCAVSLFDKAVRLEAALAATRTPASRAIYVGDEQRDAEAARKAGLDFGAVSWGYASPASLAALGPALTFASPYDLTRLLQGDG